MKAIQTTILTVALGLGAPMALAEEAHHPNQAKTMGPGSAMTETAAINKMQANAKRMQAQIDKIAKTKDTTERRRLLQEHMQTMQDNLMMGRQAMMGDCPMTGGQGGMGMMGGMGGMGMMGGMGGQGGQGGMGMAGQGGMPGNMGSADMMQRRMELLERRLDMMQQMMPSTPRSESQAK